jgi:hypothetical protein
MRYPLTTPQLDAERPAQPRPIQEIPESGAMEEIGQDLASMLQVIVSKWKSLLTTAGEPIPGGLV